MQLEEEAYISSRLPGNHLLDERAAGLESLCRGAEGPFVDLLEVHEVYERDGGAVRVDVGFHFLGRQVFECMFSRVRLGPAGHSIARSRQRVLISVSFLRGCWRMLPGAPTPSAAFDCRSFGVCSVCLMLNSLTVCFVSMCFLMRAWQASELRLSKALVGG